MRQLGPKAGDLPWSQQWTGRRGIFGRGTEAGLAEDDGVEGEAR